MKALRKTCLALVAIAAAACGSSSSTGGNNNGGPTGKTFAGSLADGSLVSLEFAQAAAVTGAAATVAVTGSITTSDGAITPLTGTYDPSTGQFSVTGGGYTLSGTYAGGAVQGTATTPAGGTVAFVAAAGGSSVTRYCGTFSHSGQVGVFNIMISGSQVYGIASDDSGGVTLTGSVNGSTITITTTDPNKKGSATGTISGTTIDGQVLDETGAQMGTFHASADACTATAASCPAFTLAAPVIPKDHSTGSPAAAAGGQIADGTYYRTKRTVYDGTTGTDTSSTSAMQLVIAGSSVQWKQQSGTDPVEAVTASATTNGSQLLLTAQCVQSSPASVGAQIAFGYTVVTGTPTKLLIYNSNNSSPEEDEFTKQ